MKAARSVIGHLHDRGHCRIAPVSGGSNRPATDRAKAFLRAMEERGLDPVVVSGGFSEEGGLAGGQELLAADELPTAVFAANDLAALGVIGALQAAGLSVPADVSVIGFDDSQIARLGVVQLTSVRQPIERFGTAAIATLLERIADNDRERTVQRLPAHLVERRTVGPPRAAISHRHQVRSGPSR